MFSRFSNLRKKFHKIFFILFFYKVEVFYWYKKIDIKMPMLEKRFMTVFWQESAALLSGHEPFYVLVLIILEKTLCSAKLEPL